LAPAIAHLVEKLRKEEHVVLHCLDAWLLKAIEKQDPASIHELAESCVMRMGPGTKGPELTPRQAERWIWDAIEHRRLIEAQAADPPEPPDPPKWIVTAKGRQRLRELSGLGVRGGTLLGWMVRMPSAWENAVARLKLEDGIGTDKRPPKRTGLSPIDPSPGDGIAPDQARANLEKVKHIVVLMMENRSFDHMLGYLDLLDGQEHVHGLSRAKKVLYEGKEYESEYLTRTDFPKSMDPPHGSEEIERQINGGAMDGFIESFARANKVDEPERVIGYYTHRELPVYDHLAHNFVICDKWFSSVPSATWPNRLCALTGTCDPEREGLLGDGELFFEMESFVRLLEDNENPDTWRWYSWDPGTLRMADERYRANALKGFHHDHFRRVAQHALDPGEVRDEEGEIALELGTGFLEDAANGDLPSVAWIDPNFIDLSILDSNSNDDHPPSDVRAGQELVMLVYRALVESPCWEDTMLVITYDEHGGFYDHEPPPAPPEENPIFDTYGVRVPAFVVSPLVESGTVSHTVFDHTSITRTILERFGVEGAVERIAEKAPRVAETEHLGRLLTRASGSPRPNLAEPNTALENWRHGRANRRSAAAPELSERSREEADWIPEPITGFPADYLNAARRLREKKLPPGHP